MGEPAGNFFQTLMTEHIKYY